MVFAQIYKYISINIGFAASTTTDIKIMINKALANVNTWLRANN